MTMNPFFGRRTSIFNLIRPPYNPPIDTNVDALIVQSSGPILLNGNSPDNELEYKCNNTSFIPKRFMILNDHNEMLYYKVSSNGRFVIDGRNFMMYSTVNFNVKTSSNNAGTFSKKELFSYQIVPDNIVEPSGTTTITNSQIRIILQKPVEFYKTDFTGYDADSNPVGTHKQTAYRIVDDKTGVTLYRTESSTELYSKTIQVSELNLNKTTSIKIYVFYIDSYGLWSMRSLLGSGVITL